MSPSSLTDDNFRFLGQPTKPGSGVNPLMADVLGAVEADLLETWQSLDGPDGDFFTWAGLTEPIIGFRRGDGHHDSGSAVDLNVSVCPYIVTRTGTTLGGEAAAADQIPMRQRAVDAYDRAVAFGTWTRPTADVSIRVNDTIEVTYDRFRELSDALVYYLCWAISTLPTRVNRSPIPNVQDLPDGDSAFGAIREQELFQPADSAIAAIGEIFADPGWKETHPDWPLTPYQQYWQMLRDYEMVRTPMLHGNPSQPITATRNPAHGFLQLRRELVCSMIHIGDQMVGGGQRQMRWGASDFGARESGDVMHFDLGRDA